MRYVLIGGSGFVGQAAVSLLREKGEEIVVEDKLPSPRSVQFMRQDTGVSKEPGRGQ